MTMMDFNAEQFKLEFNQVIKDLALSQQDANETPVKDLVTAVLDSVEIIQRFDADVEAGQTEQIEEADITQIGDYLITLLTALGDSAAHKSMPQTMLELHRLSLPVAMWIHLRKGKIKQLDISVNAIATLANEIKDAKKLAEFSVTIEKIVASVSDEIRQDLESANQMRPWLVLNINWGIVATRSHNVDTMKYVFEQIITNVPNDAKQFFQEGMQQMDIMNYPEHVKAVMQEYHDMLGGGIVVS